MAVEDWVTSKTWWHPGLHYTSVYNACFALFALSIFVAKMVCTQATDQPPRLSHGCCLLWLIFLLASVVTFSSLPTLTWGKSWDIITKGRQNVKPLPYINPSKISFFRVVDLFLQSKSHLFEMADISFLVKLGRLADKKGFSAKKRSILLGNEIKHATTDVFRYDFWFSVGTF